MPESDKLWVALAAFLTVIVLAATVARWDSANRTAVLDQKVKIACIAQGGTPIPINGTLSCLHKIARIA